MWIWKITTVSRILRRISKNVPLDFTVEEKDSKLIIKTKKLILEINDVFSELNEETRLVIYPCIHAVLLGDDIKELLMTFSEEEEIGEETALQGTIENMPE